MSGDLFGHVAERAPFVDIRNQRESVAEEKARLAMELNTLCKRPPQFLSTASIQTVRQWREAHKVAMSTLKSKASSRGELLKAIDSLRSWLPKEPA
jgi:hypothetical protein